MPGGLLCQEDKLSLRTGSGNQGKSSKVGRTAVKRIVYCTELCKQSCMKITATILLNEHPYAFDILTTLFSDRSLKLWSTATGH
jgi:hypothetical protein